MSDRRNGNRGEKTQGRTPDTNGGTGMETSSAGRCMRDPDLIGTRLNGAARCGFQEERFEKAAAETLQFGESARRGRFELTED
jgi:hypothetical protein